jgi:hypothetical protein
MTTRTQDRQNDVDAFLSWEKKVDDCVYLLVGTGLYSLPDCPTRDWFDKGVKPLAAAKRACRAAGAPYVMKKIR